jgi:hypothetical protein
MVSLSVSSPHSIEGIAKREEAVLTDEGLNQQFSLFSFGLRSPIFFPGFGSLAPTELEG